MSKKYNDVWSGVIVIAVALSIYLSTLGMKSFAQVRIEPQMVPQMVSGILGMLGLYILIGGVIGARKYTPAQKNDGERQSAGKIERITPVCTLILIFLFILLLETMGFILSAFLYLCFQITLLSADFGWKNITKNILIAALVSVLVYAAFRKGLGLLLPVGILGF